MCSSVTVSCMKDAKHAHPPLQPQPPCIPHYVNCADALASYPVHASFPVNLLSVDTQFETWAEG